MGTVLAAKEEKIISDMQYRQVYSDMRISDINGKFRGHGYHFYPDSWTVLRRVGDAKLSSKKEKIGLGCGVGRKPVGENTSNKLNSVMLLCPAASVMLRTHQVQANDCSPSPGDRKIQLQRKAASAGQSGSDRAIAHSPQLRP